MIGIVRQAGPHGSGRTEAADADAGLSSPSAIPLQTVLSRTATRQSSNATGGNGGSGDSRDNIDSITTQQSFVEPPSSSSAAMAAQQEGGLQGWTVVAGSTAIFFTTVGLVYCFGVLQSELISRHYSSSSTLGWVSSVTVVIAPLCSIPITALIRRTSNRTVGLMGAACTSVGYIATSFTFKNGNVPYLFLAQAIFGFGYALNFWASNSLAAQYFERKRGLAVGIVYAGSGVGGAVLSIGLSRLIRRVGLEWAVCIYGLMALLILVPASFTLRQRGSVTVASLKLDYFRQPNFLLLFFGTALNTFALFVPPFFLPTYAVAAGYSSETGAWLVAGYNFASAVGRIMFGLMADSRLGPVTTLCVAFILMATTILSIWVAAGTYLPPLVIFLLLNGAAGGALLSLQPTVVASMYGTSELAVTMAMVTIGRCVGSALGAPIAGYLLDAFGGPQGGTPPFRPALLVIGSISFLAAMCLLTLRLRMGGLSLKKRI
ncbi:MFS general substrate transporter [Acaromyces ingoldii]|uniref:MFS general substrate transporter n=1 Tax=Acaromyces ingoldii TaxID=215250 RepID=A0A316YMI2_9BASI|nr:MFS general substrate transporter [Acaromyces ingoldii]PWN90577.1 MFS general substrate transporter [Acaromyces ingoldii]